MKIATKKSIFFYQTAIRKRLKVWLRSYVLIRIYFCTYSHVLYPTVRNLMYCIVRYSCKTVFQTMLLEPCWGPDRLMHRGRIVSGAWPESPGVRPDSPGPERLWAGKSWNPRHVSCETDYFFTEQPAYGAQRLLALQCIYRLFFISNRFISNQGLRLFRPKQLSPQIIPMLSNFLFQYDFNLHFLCIKLIKLLI